MFRKMKNVGVLMSETFLKEEPPLDIWSIFKTITSQII